MEIARRTVLICVLAVGYYFRPGDTIESSISCTIPESLSQDAPITSRGE